MATVKNRIKRIQEKFATQSEVQYPSDIFKDSIFQVTIGNKHFTNSELALFRPPGAMEEETVGLLKRIFQEKYPSTRNNGIPKVPSKLDDKILVIKALQHHFNDIRNLLVKTRDSLSARVELEHLQKIKILIEHFENDKNTFPYHKFQDYIDNQDFIDELRTGLYAVDLFLKTTNPDRARAKAKVFSPDTPRARRPIPKPYQLTETPYDLKVLTSGSALVLYLSEINGSFLEDDSAWEVSLTVSDHSYTKSEDLENSISLSRVNGTITISPTYSQILDIIGPREPGVYDIYCTRPSLADPTVDEVINLLTANVSFELYTRVEPIYTL